MKICLLYASENPYGGWVTYTRHLHDMLSTKHDVTLAKFKDTPADKKRKFGYGLEYLPSTPQSIYDTQYDAVLVVAVQKNFAERTREVLCSIPNSGIVVHDGNEKKHVPVDELLRRVVVIRECNLRLALGSVYIPHPYIRAGLRNTSSKTAVSVSRIDHDKNTTILLDANRINKLIDIRGFENRIYTRFRVMPAYPEWVQSKAHFPRESLAAVSILKDYKFMVDMSTIKGDGGGSQYTFLEAIDAGACCVLHGDWVKVPGEFVEGINCLAASTPEQLVKVLSKTPVEKRKAIVRAAEDLLVLHDPKIILPQYEKFLKSLAKRK